MIDFSPTLVPQLIAFHIVCVYKSAIFVISSVLRRFCLSVYVNKNGLRSLAITDKCNTSFVFLPQWSFSDIKKNFRRAVERNEVLFEYVLHDQIHVIFKVIIN